MDKKSFGKDIMKIYKVKPKMHSKMMGKSMKEDSAEDENEEPLEGDLATILRQAADLVDEGAYDEAMGLIDDASEMCGEMCDSESESDMEE